MKKRNTLCKAERLNSKLVIDRLFAGGNKSIAAYPLRAVYMETDEQELPISILTSVSKRRLHKAVERNRMKRQIREAYRLSKHKLWNKLEESNKKIVIAFICISDEQCTTNQIRKSVIKILSRISEKI